MDNYNVVINKYNKSISYCRLQCLKFIITRYYIDPISIKNVASD